MPIVVTMITVGLTLVFAVAGAAWHVGMRLGTVQRGVTHGDEDSYELRTEVRDSRTEVKSEIQELCTEMHAEIGDLRSEVRQTNDKLDRILEHHPQTVP